MVTQYLNDQEEAGCYYAEGLTLSRQYNLKTNTAMILNSYGVLLLDQNRLEAAREMLRESVQLNTALGHQDGIAWAFLGLLTLHHLEGNFEKAAQLVGVQEALRQRLGAPLPSTNQLHFETITHDLQQKLGTATFTVYQEQGRNMALADTLALVTT